MYKINFDNPIHIHFIGIGGISMSGLAKILRSKGFVISGSDSAPSPLTHDLEKDGCKISYPQHENNITGGIQLVVYTAAIRSTNPELAKAVESGIPTISRADLLGQIMSNYKTAINVAGTHGKTTTTSMISELLITAESDPTITLGGILDSIGGNIRIGNSEIFLTEACEYTNSFLSFSPTINIILNVEEDHLDFFKDIDDIRSSFKRFVEKLPQDGTLIINNDIDDPEYFYKDTGCAVITVGSDPQKSKYSPLDITYDEFGCCRYTLLTDGVPFGTVSLNVPGLHNVYNSLAVIALGFELNIPFETIQRGLAKYHGAKRRFEKKGVLNGVTIIDDYAHHPDEIKATLNSAKHYPHNNIWCVFQPHTYSRTKILIDKFAETLTAADKVILSDIYAARETDTLGISSVNLMEKIKNLGTECYYFSSFEKIEKFLLNNCINGDLLITMGAGNIYQVGENLLK